MKLYTGNKIDNIKEVKLIDVIAENLKTHSEHTIEVGYASDESGSWISVKKETPTLLKNLELQFNYEGTLIDNVSYYETPIERLINDEKSKKLF